MSWNVYLASIGFPPQMQAAFPGHFTVTEADLFWAAITVGRPSLQHVFQFGQYSLEEALGRWGMMSANIARHPRVSGLHNSPAFNALDPTEKGWVNFSLGMIFTKICAEKLLRLPWLMHFKWFAANNPVVTHAGGSTPDFIGLDPVSGDYHVLEAKGRVGGYSKSVLDTAKAQAQQAVSVRGQPCSLHIGALLYRIDERFCFAWEDPAADDRPEIELKDTQATWREYYRIAWGLHALDQTSKDALAAATGWYCDFDEEAAKHIALLVGETNAEWEKSRDALIKWSTNAGLALRIVTDTPGGQFWFADGIILRPSDAPRSERSAAVES